MGNTPSTASGSRTADDASLRSESRNPIRILRKSSINLFGKHESKSPLPPQLSTVVHVRERISPVPRPAQANGLRSDGTLSRAQHDGASPAFDPPPLSPASTVTMTEMVAARPLSGSTTVRDSRCEVNRASQVANIGRDSYDDDHSDHAGTESPSPSPDPRQATLSPTLPAPSPLPEDSPHKYGLKDRMDTPEEPEPEDINVAKARRRSTGLEIFHVNPSSRPDPGPSQNLKADSPAQEAKSLQTASSFLNGLSTSRRRAESAQRSTSASAWQTTSASSTRPSSATFHIRTSTSRPPSTSLPAITFTFERRTGHNFKPSGFAYTRPLALSQMKCKRGHERLLPSRNKVAPVECAICHIDDEGEHFSCSWCALRMCRYCRLDLRERGEVALRERVRLAEMGGGSDGDEEGFEDEDRGRWMDDRGRSGEL